MASPVPIDAPAFSPTHYSTFLDISKSMGFPVMTIARWYIPHLQEELDAHIYRDYFVLTYGLLPGSSLRSVALSISTENRGVACTHCILWDIRRPFMAIMSGGYSHKTRRYLTSTLLFPSMSCSIANWVTQPIRLTFWRETCELVARLWWIAGKDFK